MKKIENECVGCPSGRGCLCSSCKYLNVVRYYCDYCKEEATLYKYDGDEICIDCLMQNLEVVEGSDVF